MLRLSSADTDRASRLAALAACVVAAAACAWLTVRVVWLFVPHTDSTPAPPLATTSSAGSAATSIAQWHLFGNSQTVDLAARARNAPKTALDLVLRGTFAATDPQQGIAIIAQGQRERSFSVGDAVGNATLSEVYPDHVVLAHDGVAETLNMLRPDDHAATAADRPAAPRVPASASSIPPGYAPGAAAPGAGLSGASAGSAVLARSNAADLARDVRFEPVFDNGRVAGARLSGSGAAATLMNQVGLRPTDVVTAVNGTQLSNVSNPQQLIEQFGNAASLQVTIQRDGHPLTLTLNLR